MKYTEQYVSALSAVELGSRGETAWFGEPLRELPRRVRRSLSATAMEEHVLATLARQFYRGFFLTGCAKPNVNQESDAPRAMGRTPLVQQLIDANLAPDIEESGWRVLTRQDGEAVLARRESLTLRLSVGEYRLESRDTEVSESVCVLCPSYSLNASPGFFVVSGGAPFRGGRAGGALLRLYLKCEPDSAPDLMRLLTGALERLAFSYQLKILNDPSLYWRSDAAVLYIPSQEYSRILPVLSAIPLAAGGRVPALTKPIAVGIALAEDPGDGFSFGMSRCRVLARAVIRAGPSASPQRRLVSLREEFGMAGLDPDTPYVNPGKLDTYSVIDVAPDSVIQSSIVDRVAHAVPSKHEILDLAARLADRLAERSIRSSGLCSWVGASAASPAGVRGVSYGALGGDLYGGTAGVALFLGETAEATGSGHLGQLALEALRHAMAPRPETGTPPRQGLYDGWPGTALAGARLSYVMDSDEAASLTVAFINAHVRGLLVSDRSDLMSGVAGCILGCVTLNSMGIGSSLLDLGVELGNSLLQRAVAGHNQDISWNSDIPARRSLTGYSHGAGGIGHAFIELGNATGLPRFTTAGLAAFSYERRWHDPARDSWRDFRSERLVGSGASQLAWAAQWCHGSPGILVSRLAACRYLGEPSVEADAWSALRATRRALQSDLLAGGHDLSLCHGVTGLAEVERGSHRALAECNLDPGVSRHDREAVALVANSFDALPSMCGSPGESPGLMLGLSGMGHFLLRTIRENVPSPVFISPITWAL